MNKKIIILVVVILIAAIAAAGIYFGFFRKSSFEAIGELEIPEIKLSFESGVSDLELNNFDIGVPLPSNLFSNISVDTNLGGYKGGTEISLPSVSIETPSFKLSAPAGTGAPPSGPKLDETTCGQFKAAPSCSYVPQQYQDLCQKCKAAGY